MKLISLLLAALSISAPGVVYEIEVEGSSFEGSACDRLGAYNAERHKKSIEAVAVHSYHCVRS